MRYYTNSEIGTYLRCRRKWYLAYVRKLHARREKFRPARTVGAIVHDCLAQEYEGQVEWKHTLKLHADILLDIWGDVLPEDPDLAKEIKDTLEYVAAIVEGYWQWVEEEGGDSDLRLIDVEQERSVELDLSKPEPVALLGKLDARFQRESDGMRVFMDHKVVGDLVKFPRWAHMSPQMLTYHLIEYLLQEEKDVTDGGIYNLLRKSKRTARATPPFYLRHEVRHNLHQLRAFYVRTASLISTMYDTEVRLNEGSESLVECPPAPNEDCAWSCEFFTMCGMMDDGSDWGGLLEEAFMEGNPLARYVNIEKR